MTKTTLPLGRDDRFALDMGAEEFRALGHRLVDELAGFYESLPERRVTSGESGREIRAALPRRALPARGRSADELLAEITPLLMEHSLFNGHPRFFGYITSSAAPLGALADFLAAETVQGFDNEDVPRRHFPGLGSVQKAP